MSQCLLCDFAVTENVATPSSDTRCSYLLWNFFLQANSKWEHLYFLKWWNKRRQSSLLKSTPLLKGSSVASPYPKTSLCHQHYCGFVRLVCQGGSTALLAPIYLARYSSVKNCYQDSMLILNLLHSKWWSKALQSLTLFRTFFGGGTKNVPGKLKFFFKSPHA